MKYLNKFGKLVCLLLITFITTVLVISFTIHNEINGVSWNIPNPFKSHKIETIEITDLGYLVVSVDKHYGPNDIITTNYDLELIYNETNTASMVYEYHYEDYNETRDMLYANIKFLSDKFDELLLSTNIDKFEKETGLMTVYSEMLNLSQVNTNMVLMETDYQLRNYYDAVLDEISRLMK